MMHRSLVFFVSATFLWIIRSKDANGGPCPVAVFVSTYLNNLYFTLPLGGSRGTSGEGHLGHPLLEVLLHPQTLPSLRLDPPGGRVKIDVPVGGKVTNMLR